MEILFRKIPLVRRMILKNLDNQSLTKCIEAKHGFAEFLNNEKFFWIRMINKYTRNFEGVEDAWIEVLHRTPVDIVKQLACTVEEFFDSCSSKKMSPLQIVAKKGTVHLFQYAISKATDKNPIEAHGSTLLHHAVRNDCFDIARLDY